MPKATRSSRGQNTESERNRHRISGQCEKGSGVGSFGPGRMRTLDRGKALQINVLENIKNSLPLGPAVAFILCARQGFWSFAKMPPALATFVPFWC